MLWGYRFSLSTFHFLLVILFSIEYNSNLVIYFLRAGIYLSVDNIMHPDLMLSETTDQK